MAESGLAIPSGLVVRLSPMEGTPTGLAPVEYYVGAWANLDSGWVAPSFLSYFEGDVATVLFEANEQETMSVDIVPATRLAEEIAEVSR